MWRLVPNDNKYRFLLFFFSSLKPPPQKLAICSHLIPWSIHIRMFVYRQRSHPGTPNNYLNQWKPLFFSWMKKVKIYFDFIIIHSRHIHSILSNFNICSIFLNIFLKKNYSEWRYAAVVNFLCVTSAIATRVTYETCFLFVIFISSR